MKFKKLKGVSKEMRDIIFYDLELLQLKKNKDNEYHYNLLKLNLQDLFGKQKGEE
jgi:hypothetical protein